MKSHNFLKGFISFFLYFVTLYSMWNLSSPTRDHTCDPCIGSTEYWPLDHQRSPRVFNIIKIQFSSVTQSCPTLCDPMDCNTPGFPVHHQLPELAQTHHSKPSSWWCHPTISSSVIPFSSHLQSFPASGSFQMSQFFTSHQVARILEFQFQDQSFQWIFRTDFL